VSKKEMATEMRRKSEGKQLLVSLVLQFQRLLKPFDFV
jgi:hypothetical protein